MRNFGTVKKNVSLVEECLSNNINQKKLPIIVYVDSDQLKSSLSSSHLVSEKLLRINVAEIKQVVNKPSEQISVHWVSTKEMLCDCLTKIGASTDKLCYALEHGKILMI